MDIGKEFTRIGSTQALVFRYVVCTGNTVFSVPEVADWLREQGVEVSEAALRSALRRLARRSLVKSIGADVWMVGRDVFNALMSFCIGEKLSAYLPQPGGRGFRIVSNSLDHMDSDQLDTPCCPGIKFIPKSLRGHHLDGVFIIRYDENLGSVVVEYKPFGDVVEDRGVDGTVKLGENELLEVAAGMLIDILHQLPRDQAEKLLKQILKHVPKRILDKLFKHLCI